MTPEKKPGVVNALSRILHLHQLPDHPTVAVERLPLVLARTPLAPPIKGEAVASIPPAYVGKPFITPEARRNQFIPIPPVSMESASSTNMNTRTTIAATSPTPSPPTLHGKKIIPASAPASPNPWPFPAHWIKSTTPSNAKPLDTTAKMTQQPLTSPASEKPSVPPLRSTIPAPRPMGNIPVGGVSPAKFPTSTQVNSPVTLSSSPPRMNDALSSGGTAMVSGESIVTNFDRILDIVKLQKNIKLDELTKRMGMPEEKVAEELQTLEDNGLIEVRYPAFGEPIIYYKG